MNDFRMLGQWPSILGPFLRTIAFGSHTGPYSTRSLKQLTHTSRPPRGGVDRNQHKRAERVEHLVAPPAGAWIETCRYGRRVMRTVVAPPAGAWIETAALTGSLKQQMVAPPAGAWIETFSSRKPD